MDLTPQTLREVEFREKLRGYHPDDVDDFLEDVAVSLEGLLARLNAAEAAAEAARSQGLQGGLEAPPQGAALSAAPPPQFAVSLAEPPPPPPPPAPEPVAAAPPEPAVVSQAVVPAPTQAVAPVSSVSGVTEETLSRALVLAQRTADIAVAEAQETATRLVEDARAEAQRIRQEAQSEASSMVQEARASMEASVAELAERRVRLEREITSLQTWGAQQRDRLRELLADHLRSLEVWLAGGGQLPTTVPPSGVLDPPPPVDLGTTNSSPGPSTPPWPSDPSPVHAGESWSSGSPAGGYHDPYGSRPAEGTADSSTSSASSWIGALPLPPAAGPGGSSTAGLGSGGTVGAGDGSAGFGGDPFLRRP